jgi:hypothetical protein
MRKRNTELLKDVIQQVLQTNKLDKHLNEKHIIDAWPKVLGDNIIQYTTDLYVRNRVLYVSLSSSVLRHDLFLSREKIKNSLNAMVGGEVIKEIVLK